MNNTDKEPVGRDFAIEIAGTVFSVKPLFESTRDHCRRYWSNVEPELAVADAREDLQIEQAMLDLEADELGLKRRKFSEPFLERAVIQRKIADALASRDVLMFHGSTVAVDGQAYLFTADCGTGKSTHTRLWRELFGERAVMVNDDKPFLRFAGDQILACGSPWSGKHGLDTNIQVPLKGICILRRGSKDVIRPIGREEAVQMLQRQCHCPQGSERPPALLEELMVRVPLWEMECTKDIRAAQVAFAAMSGEVSAPDPRETPPAPVR